MRDRHALFQAELLLSPLGNKDWVRFELTPPKWMLGILPVKLPIFVCYDTKSIIKQVAVLEI